MNTEVAASESSVIQKDDDLYPSDTIVEQAVNQHALLKHPESMDKKEEDISEDATEEVYLSPATMDESIKACLPETGIKLTATSINSVDDTQNTHDDIRHEIPSAEKGDIESTLPKELQPEIMQTSLKESSSINMGDNIASDSKVVEVELKSNEINAEVSQLSSMLLKPDIEKTAEYASDEMGEENFSEKITPPIEEKPVEKPFYEESRETGDISAELKAGDDSSMKKTEIDQAENKHIPLIAEQEGKSPQVLTYEKESDNEGMSPEDAQQISEEISESRNESCADEEAEPTSEPQQSYQEILEPKDAQQISEDISESRNESCADEEAKPTSEPQQSYQEILVPSQIICEGANGSKEYANDNSTEREVTTSTEEMLVDSGSTIEECSKQIKSEICESKTIRLEDGAYVDELAEHATIEAAEKNSQVGLAAVTGPANIQENDEHQTCQAEIEENETVSEMITQNQIFPESDLHEKNVISTESISYDNANTTNAALEGDDEEGVASKAEETGYSFEEQSVDTATREPYSSEHISSTNEISVPFSEKGDSAISTNGDKISNLNDNGNMESIDTEAKLGMMQEVENKREIIVETPSDDITKEINDESYIVSENQVDNLTNKATDEPGLIVDIRQSIPLPAENQISKLTDIREKEYETEGEKNSTEEENESIHSPDKDTEKDFESNNEDIQNDSKQGQSCGNEPDLVKNLETVNSDNEETKLDQGEQQTNYIHIDAIGSLGTDGDAQSTFTNIQPSPENNEEDVKLRSTRDVTSAEEKLEDSINSAAAENSVTSEASINKGDDQNENQSLSVTCVQAGTEAEDTINKADDSEKEIDLQHTEETQSTRNVTLESFPNAITDEIEDDKNLENASPSQQHDEINTKNSNCDEESNEYNEQEPNESNEFHLKDESNTGEAKNQVYEEESSDNKERINGTVEVSQSQDECSKVYEDSIHVIEVEETTDKQHEEQEDRSPYGEHDGVLADQVKAMDASIDSQNENELNTSNSDGVHVQEDQTERETCNYDVDESDTRKNGDLISHQFEQDKLVNAITSQESSPAIEPLDHNLGAAMIDPTVSQPSEVVDDESLSFEASQEVGIEAEQHIQTNEDPEQENDISADTIVQGASAGNLQHGSAEHLKVVDCTDDKPTENLQESESENQGLATKEVDIVIQTNEDHNFDQLPKHLEHNNDAHENEGAQKDDQQVLLEAGSDVEEFQDMKANPTELGEHIGTESDNAKGQGDEEGMCDDTVKTVPVTDPKIEGDISAGIPSHSEKLKINADNPVKSRDEGTEETSEVMQVVDIHEEVSADCLVSPKEVVNQVLHLDPGVDLQQENERNTDSLDEELINKGFEQDSISSEISCQETSATIEAFRQETGTAMDDHTLNKSSEIANDEVHIVEVSKEADSETEQHNQINEEPEHGNEISADESMDVENHKYIPESPELREVSNTENEAINISAADINSITPEDLSGNENTNLDSSQTVTKLDEDPKVNTEVMPQDIRVENRELVPESAELAEEKNTENEEINSRAEELGSNAVEDSENGNKDSEISQKEINTEVVLQNMSIESCELVLESTKLAEDKNIENEAINSRASELCSNTIGDSGNENTDLEISQKEINTDVVRQDMDIENHKLIPESTKLREANNAENEAINSRAADLGSNTVEDLSGNENTHAEISQKVPKLDEDPGVNTEVMPQDFNVENREVIPESVELTEENNTENGAVNSNAEHLGLNMVRDGGNENKNLEISQSEIGLNENPVVNREVVLQDFEVDNHELIPDSTELREENNDNETINIRAEYDLNGNENTNSEISQKVTNLNEDPRLNTEVMPQDIGVENHGFISESKELREENNTENEAVDSITKALGSNIVEDLSGNQNTNSEISKNEINLEEDPKDETEVVLQGMSVKDSALVPESAELTEDNNTDNEAIRSRAEDLGSNTMEDSESENTDFRISEKEISLNENPIVNTNILQDMDVESHELIPESTELREEKSAENEAVNSKAMDLGSNTVENLSGNENTNSEMSQKVTSLDEDPKVDTEVMPQDVDIGDHEIIPESTELREENNTGNEAINSKADDPGSNTIKDSSGKENTNLEISQKEISLNEDPVVESDGVVQDMDVENHKFVPEPTELVEENNTKNEAIYSKAEESGPNTAGDLGGNENTNSEISQKKINLDEDPLVKVNMLQTMEKIQDNEKPKNTERESTEEGSQHTLAEERPIHEEKAIDTADASQLEIEENTCVYEEQIQEVNETHELNGQPTQTQSGNGILTATEPSEYIHQWGPNDSKQEEYVSNATKSHIDGHSVDEMTPNETAETQGKQPVEPQKNFLEPPFASEATCTTQNKEDCSVTLQDLKEVKEEDSTPEKATQRELQVSSGFDLCRDLPYIPAVEEVSKTKEYLPEIQGAHDPQKNEMEPPSCTNNYSHEINNEADQFQINSQQTAKVSCADDPPIRPISENYGHISEEVTENQEETKSPEQLIEMNNEEQTIEDIIDGHSHQVVKTLKSEMTVEESKSEEDYEPHATSAYDSTEEKLVPAGSAEIVERSSELGLYKESKKVEDEIMEEKEEANADAESLKPEFYEIDNDTDRDGKTFNTECNTKSDECPITISKDSQEISEKPNIIVTSTSLEGEAIGEIFQQNKSGERTENEVRPMESKIDASELLHQMNVPKLDNMDVNKEKQQESAKNLEWCSTLEPQQENDRILFTEIQAPEDVSSREIDPGHSEVKLKLDEIPSEGKFKNASDVHMDCQEAEKVSAADIIASHIRQEIEAEDNLQQPSSEHQKQRPETSTLVTDVNDKTFNEEALHDESTENTFMSFDNPAEIICAPVERETEYPSLEAEPSSDLEQKQELKEKHGTMDDSVRTGPDELSSEFQGSESCAEVKSDIEDSTIERLNAKEVCHLNEIRESDESSELDFKSQPISGDNLVNSHKTSTENFEPVIELQSEKLAVSEEIRNDAQLQTVKNEITGESNPLNFEVYEAVATDAAEEEEMHNINTTISSKDRALVQPDPTTKSSAETEKPLIADEHSANTTYGVSQVSGINSTPPTETNAAEEKVSEQLIKKVSDQDGNITQTMQINEEQQLQGNYDNLHQSSHLQELCGKDSVNLRIADPIDTVAVNYNGMNIEDFSKEGSESNTNEAASLKEMQSVTTSKEEITADKYNETEENPMLPSAIDEKKGEDIIVTHNLQDADKKAAEEPKTKKEKEDTDHGEEDSELEPMISSRDVELKTQNKKSQHILSGMGSKMKNSISKVKKAMACASPQFSPDEVIIKLNKSKKS